jgi:hypothetical protein
MASDAEDNCLGQNSLYLFYKLPSSCLPPASVPSKSLQEMSVAWPWPDPGEAEA